MMQETMLQEVMAAPREIRFDRVPVPTAGPGQVLVKISASASAAPTSTYTTASTPTPSTRSPRATRSPARSRRLGEGVTQFQVGQRVTIEPQVYCGECYPCTHGKYNLCENLKVMGFQTTGTASEYFAVDASKVTALPAGMSYDEGAMLEPLAVTVHAARRAGDVAGKKVCVLGCGPIGILLVQSLKAFGAAEVMATDISDYRLELARTCGADYAVNTKTRPFGAALTECFGPDKADIIYDCAGNDTTMDQAIQNARKGSVIILVAVYAGLAHCDLAKLNDSELDLNTTMMYRHEDYVDAIRFVREGMVQLQPLMSRHFAFTDYLAAYEYIDTHQETTMKVLIDVDPSDD